MDKYIWQNEDWPNFRWDAEAVLGTLARVRFQQGRFLGRMTGMSPTVCQEVNFQILATDALTTSEIEGEILNRDSVRSSAALRLGVPVGGLSMPDRKADGVVEMVLDATQTFGDHLTRKKLEGWHACLFPEAGIRDIRIGNYRAGPVQIVSGPIGHERSHFEALPHENLNQEMRRFFQWFNHPPEVDGLVRASIATLWLLIVHPFDDGNGRIARAIADKALAQDEKLPHRFYSMSSQIQADRTGYYAALGRTNHSDMNVTGWVVWFLECLGRAISGAEETLAGVIRKAEFWQKHAQTPFNPRQVKSINRMLDGFQGHMTSRKWAAINRCSQPTAVRDINDLLVKDVLNKNPGGSKKTSFHLN